LVSCSNKDRGQEYGGGEDVVGAKSAYMRLVDQLDRRPVSSDAASKDVKVRSRAQRCGAEGHADENRPASMALHLAN